MNSPKFFTSMVSIALATLGVVVLPSPAARAQGIPDGWLQRDKPEIAAEPNVQKSYRHFERARITDTRKAKADCEHARRACRKVLARAVGD